MLEIIKKIESELKSAKYYLNKTKYISTLEYAELINQLILVSKILTAVNAKLKYTNKRDE